MDQDRTPDRRTVRQKIHQSGVVQVFISHVVPDLNSYVPFLHGSLNLKTSLADILQGDLAEGRKPPLTIGTLLAGLIIAELGNIKSDARVPIPLEKDGGGADDLMVDLVCVEVFQAGFWIPARTRDGAEIYSTLCQHSRARSPVPILSVGVGTGVAKAGPSTAAVCRSPVRNIFGKKMAMDVDGRVACAVLGGVGGKGGRGEAIFMRVIFF
jgi:hypothetical protein